MAVEVAAVVEARADHELVDALVRRVCPPTTAVTWFEPAGSNQPFLLWKDRRSLRYPNGRPIRPRSRFGGAPSASYAVAADAFLLHLDACHRTGTALGVAILLVDQDDDPDRICGLAQARARDGHSWPFDVAIGVAVTKRECWVLLGFKPEDAEDQRLFQEERQRLGFDPTVMPHELTGVRDANRQPAKRSAKRVLDVLTRGERQREERCIEVVLAALEQRPNPDPTGLAEFVEELRRCLPP